MAIKDRNYYILFHKNGNSCTSINTLKMNELQKRALKTADQELVSKIYSECLKIKKKKHIEK